MLGNCRRLVHMRTTFMEPGVSNLTGLGETSSNGWTVLHGVDPNAGGLCTPFAVGTAPGTSREERNSLPGCSLGARRYGSLGVVRPTHKIEEEARGLSAPTMNPMVRGNRGQLAKICSHVVRNSQVPNLLGSRHILPPWAACEEVRPLVLRPPVAKDGGETLLGRVTSPKGPPGAARTLLGSPPDSPTGEEGPTWSASLATNLVGQGITPGIKGVFLIAGAEPTFSLLPIRLFTRRNPTVPGKGTITPVGNPRVERLSEAVTRWSNSASIKRMPHSRGNGRVAGQGSVFAYKSNPIEIGLWLLQCRLWLRQPVSFAEVPEGGAVRIKPRVCGTGQGVCSVKGAASGGLEAASELRAKRVHPGVIIPLGAGREEMPGGFFSVSFIGAGGLTAHVSSNGTFRNNVVPIACKSSRTSERMAVLDEPPRELPLPTRRC